LTEHLSLVLRLSGTWYWGQLDSASRVTGDGTRVSTAQVDDKGVGFRGGVGLRYTFAKIFLVGMTPLIGYHDFFKGGDSNAGPVKSSSGWDFQALAYLRAGVGI